MKAMLKEDIITHVTMLGDVEIGDLIPGVGLERLRFNGVEVVDLADLSEIWVRPLSDTFFELHSIEVPGSQLVTMEYVNRKRLYLDDGVVKIRAEQEQIDKELAEEEDIEDNFNLRQVAKQLVQDLTFADIDTHIDNVFGNLNAAQKTSLKRVYKVVLLLAKKA